MPSMQKSHGGDKANALALRSEGLHLSLKLSGVCDRLHSVQPGDLSCLGTAVEGVSLGRECAAADL